MEVLASTGKPAARVLFIPVSGPRGMGEYARALALALALSARDPSVAVHFALSKEAPYAADVPFPCTLMPSSPTFHSDLVAALIREFRPTLVVFDNAGRTAQLRAAVRSGARVIYISSRPRQRRKAFRLKWMGLLDEHWIAYPEFIAGSLGILERAKLRWLGRPCVQFLDTVLPPPDAALSLRIAAQFRTAPGQYVLMVPGGGTDHPGAENAPSVFADTARQLAERGLDTILIGLKTACANDHLRVGGRLPMASLVELIRGARLVISNGGDTLLQTIACARPCVAVPIAGDQSFRIQHCEKAGFARGAALDSAAIVSAAIEELETRTAPARVPGSLCRVSNGMDVAVDAIVRLSAPPAGAASPGV